MYTIFCFLQGQGRPFPVDIDETRTVAHLRMEIKNKNSVALATVDADALQLYHVNLPYDKDKYIEQIDRELSKRGPLDSLDQFDELKDVIGDPPAPRTIRILVPLPPSELIDSTACDTVTETHPPDNLHFTIRPALEIFMLFLDLLSNSNPQMGTTSGRPRINPYLVFTADAPRHYGPQQNLINEVATAPPFINAVQERLRAKRTLTTTQRVWVLLHNPTFLFSQHLYRTFSSLPLITKETNATSMTISRSLEAVPDAPMMSSRTTAGSLNLYQAP